MVIANRRGLCATISKMTELNNEKNLSYGRNPSAHIYLQVFGSYVGILKSRVLVLVYGWRRFEASLFSASAFSI